MGLYLDIEKKLKDITLRVTIDTSGCQGITGILGASGCGKSMTLKSIAGIVRPDRGTIRLNDRILFDSEQKTDIRIQERRAGYLFQNYALFPNMTIRENIQIAIRDTTQKQQELVDFYLELMKLSELGGRYPGRLSGGQQQRVALARILASQPEVLMLDEPFSALDTYLKELLQIELLDILKTYQGDILMVTHNRDEVYRFCDQIYILDEGRLVASGPTRQVFADPQAIAAARLTGCKNIEPATKQSEHKLFVPRWGQHLTTKRPVPNWLSAVGIRAHFLRPAADDTGQNCIACHWDKVLEDPFEMTAITSHGIWWKVSKEDWQHRYHQQLPAFLQLPEESILFLKD
ncbi:MAG: sulfate/molybdate ABC transporter ATP-binding protein [Lachnospiraceae bacterium]